VDDETIRKAAEADIEDKKARTIKKELDRKAEEE
tara:strand:+ start:727 stop:828 length:102 start_codon:yes stop_codon:yes gene_type:complete